MEGVGAEVIAAVLLGVGMIGELDGDTGDVETVISTVDETEVEGVSIGVDEKLLVGDGEAPSVNDEVGDSELVGDGVTPFDRVIVGVTETVGDVENVTEADGDGDIVGVNVAVAVAVGVGAMVVST